MRPIRAAILSLIIGALGVCAAKAADLEYEVTARAGLRIRAAPDLAAAALAVAPNGTRLQWISDGARELTIDGIRGRWLRVRWNTEPQPIEGWAFSGYLRPTTVLAGQVYSPDNRHFYVLARDDAKKADPETCAQLIASDPCDVKIFSSSGAMVAEVSGYLPMEWLDSKRLRIRSYAGECGAMFYEEAALSVTGEKQSLWRETEKGGVCPPLDDGSTTTHTICIKEACLVVKRSNDPARTEVRVDDRLYLSETGNDFKRLPFEGLKGEVDTIVIALNGRKHRFSYVGGVLQARQ